jgi:hypothetical protein
MERMGHASSRAALIYLHTNDGRHRGVAQAMSELITEGLRDDPDDGLPVASGT